MSVPRIGGIPEKNFSKIQIPIQRILDLQDFASSIEIKNEKAHKGYSKVRLTGDMFSSFYHHGLVCNHCGDVGSYFRMGKSNGSGGWQLFLFTAKGRLMTSDHIWPTSKGGVDSMWNRQSLCDFCNQLKANRFPSERELDLLASRGVDLRALIRKTRLLKKNRKEVKESKKKAAEALKQKQLQIKKRTKNYGIIVWKEPCSALSVWRKPIVFSSSGEIESHQVNNQYIESNQ